MDEEKAVAWANCLLTFVDEVKVRVFGLICELLELDFVCEQDLHV